MNLTETSCCKSGTCAPSTPETVRTVRPAISTRDEEGGVRLSVALPGVRKDGLKLTVHEGLLSIEAPRAGTASDIRYSLSVKLADRLDGNRIQAALEDGILNVLVPLRDEAKPKEIPIG